jgi:3-oxoacyl-[acyl-carrier-protein] synthase-3
MAAFSTSRAGPVGFAATLPTQKVTTGETGSSLGIADPAKIVAMTGIHSRHIAAINTCTSDLCADAAQRLLERLQWHRESVDALIFVTQTPDYTLPATACLLQDRLGLSKNCAAFDINLGCSGFVYGLAQACSLIESGLERVLLLAGDTSSKYVSQKDKSAIFLFGDCGTATAIEKKNCRLTFTLGTDGAGAPHLIIPVGRFRNPGCAESLEAVEMEGGNIRNQHQLYMNGAEVMTFTLRVLPGLWKELFERDGCDPGSLDAVVMHQANQFILDTVAKRLKIHPEKVLSTLANFGNTSSASIPLTIAECLRKETETSSKKLALLGFGVGWSWGGCVGDFGPLVIVPTSYI